MPEWAGLAHVHPSPFPAPFVLPDLDEADRGPSSRVRPLDPVGAMRSLVVYTDLRGHDAEAAWVTVSDPFGVVYFEGAVAADGTIAVYVDESREVHALQVLLETPRVHRQSEVVLGPGITEYRFSAFR